jgi:hypothetical protein
MSFGGSGSPELRSKAETLENRHNQKTDNYGEEIRDSIDEQDLHWEGQWDELDEAVEEINSWMNHGALEDEFYGDIDRAVRYYVVGTERNAYRPSSPSGPSSYTSSPF